VFIISFIFIGTYFFLNFFIGIIFSYFTLANKRSRTHAFLTEDQIRWIEIQKLILRTEPFSISPPTRKYQKSLSSFLNHKGFKDLLLALLIVDILRQAFFKHEMTYGYRTFWEISNYLFFFFYFVETTVKFVALGAKGFFWYKRHYLELFVVLSYIVLFFLEMNINLMDEVSGRRAIRFFRVFRLLSSLRFILMIKSLRNFLINISFALPFLLNMFSIICLTFFMYAVIACYLFGNVKTGEFIDDYVNFSNLIYSFMTLFRCSTAEDWVGIMFDVSKVKHCEKGVNCGSSMKPIFYNIISN
jgi:hypothetical protein